MAPHPSPTLGSGQGPSMPAKKTNLASLLADIADGTANVLPHHFIESTATPEPVSTTPDPLPITGRKRAVMGERAANNANVTRTIMRERANDDDSLTREKMEEPAANDLSPPCKEVKVRSQDNIEDKENEGPKNLTQQHELSPTRKDLKPQGQSHGDDDDDDGDKENKHPESQPKSDTIVLKNEARQRKQANGQKNQDQGRTQLHNQEYVPRRFFDTETHRWWIDCEYCRGEGCERENRPWKEHDREGAHKRVDAHSKNIKITCIYCRFYFDQYGMIGCRPQ
ncbi:hypothetical protein E2P81_ATG08170 [Venturia nashicola]|uniref:Uncharacterized protein n=1 Tax=Venturia nashicola TaxID=86259 RepID=A0A4Z1NLV0_9PEZI|nr:hypothetical protein E6O75_ATG08347 [Venturia nashicola]TLD21582.1 hypothetical protein E2P81_ATG08170 [Venturia nashicola]